MDATYIPTLSKHVITFRKLRKSKDICISLPEGRDYGHTVYTFNVSCNFYLVYIYMTTQEKKNTRHHGTNTWIDSVFHAKEASNFSHPSCYLKAFLIANW